MKKTTAKKDEPVTYKVVEEGFLLGVHYKKRQKVQMTEKQAEMFLREGRIEPLEQADDKKGKAAPASTAPASAPKPDQPKA